MLLIDLPPDILIHRPDYLDSFDDLYSLIQTSRAPHIACAGYSAKLRPDFAKEMWPKYSPTHSYCLLSGIARQIADWAVQNEENQNLLMNAISERPEGLLELGAQIARLSLNDVKEIHKAKLSVFNPLANIIDLECGSGYRDDPECGYPVSKVFCDNVMETLYHFVIYRELFHHCIDQVLTPLTNVNHLSAFVRRSWMAYCMPDMKYEETR